MSIIEKALAKIREGPRSDSIGANASTRRDSEL